MRTAPRQLLPSPSRAGVTVLARVSKDLVRSVYTSSWLVGDARATSSFFLCGSFDSVTPLLLFVRAFFYHFSVDLGFFFLVIFEVLGRFSFLLGKVLLF